jgi:hypothetical protein
MQNFHIEIIVNPNWERKGSGGFHLVLIRASHHWIRVTAQELDKLQGVPVDDLFVADESEIRERLGQHFDSETVDVIIKKLKVMPHAT